MEQITIFDLIKPEPLEPFTIKYWDSLGYIHAEDIMTTPSNYLKAVKEWREKNPDKHFISAESY